MSEKRTLLLALLQSYHPHARTSSPSFISIWTTLPSLACIHVMLHMERKSAFLQLSLYYRRISLSMTVIIDLFSLYSLFSLLDPLASISTLTLHMLCIGCTLVIQHFWYVSAPTLFSLALLVLLFQFFPLSCSCSCLDTHTCLRFHSWARPLDCFSIFSSENKCLTKQLQSDGICSAPI